MKTNARKRRHVSIRNHISGTSQRPRFCVFRSSKHISAQIIDDVLGKTLVSEQDKALSGTKKEKAYNLGKELAKKAKSKKIKAVVFDRGGFVYQGRIAEVARGAREEGLQF